jgi:ribosomal-protein-alanine N-acetyltransferase
MTTVRRAERGDLAQIQDIQLASPQAAQWNVTDYLQHDLLVACEGIRLIGFLVGHTLGPGESEILNLAVAPEYRRRGVARELLRHFLSSHSGEIFLEVRASNMAARLFYKSLDFEEVSTRSEYYREPLESAIVMKFHSC